jgi:general secretion pathway protein D
LGLQHAQCDELSGTLGQILSGTGGGGQPQSGRQRQQQRQPGGTRGGGRGQPTPQAAPSAVSGEAGGIFEHEVRVTCDVATNSLVAVSTLRDYIELRNLIDRLDRPRRQVFLEAVIMDVNVNHKRDLGLGYHGGYSADLGGGGNTIFYGGLNASSSLTGVPSSLEALAFGVRGPNLAGSETLLGTGKSIPAFGVVLHALATSGDSNVLATPHVLATDNITAEINIGANIPIQTNVGGGLQNLAAAAGAAGTAGAAGGLAGLSGLIGGGGFSAPRQDIGIKLSITPHVNDSDQVRMEISEEFSDAGSPEGALGVVPINKRTAETTVIVRDQQTVVIGGLVREGQINGVTKIPILGDIPVLGILFRRNETKVQKTNLLLILTPHIVRDPSDLRRIFERKMQERQEFLDRYFLFDDTTPWEPPVDYTRAVGMLEHIRGTQLDIELREKLQAELAPKRSTAHDPVAPLSLPSIAGPGKPGAGPRPAGNVVNPGTPPQQPTPPISAPGQPTQQQRPQFRVPGATPNRYRIE